MAAHTPGVVCPTEEELDAFIDSSAPGVASHVDGCEECRARLEELKADRRLLKELSRAMRLPKREGVFPEIPGFEVVAELHRGGQGLVYRAVQLSAHREVALKVLLHGPWATDRQRRRFEREIDLAARLQHPNIVTVFASGVTEDGRHYFAMEHVDGVALDEHIRGEKVEEGGARGVLVGRLELFRGVCAGVGYAHQRGVIHRDLKPSNILVDGEGRARVLDFGLAKSMGEAEGPTLSLTGEFMGTPAYASPEHTRGDPDQIDVRSDVYSLGVILYEMVTGHFPYPVTGPIGEALRAITQADPEKPGSWYRRWRQSGETGPALRVDGELETIILKALAKEPERRYQSVEELSRDLERYLTGQPIDAHPDSSWYVIRKTIARHRVPVAAGALFVVLIAGFAVASALQNGVIRSQRDTIREERDAAVAAQAQAEEETRRADQERKNTDRTNKVLTRILEGADPHQAQGREVTVSEILSKSDEWLSKELGDTPEVEASVRGTLGMVYLHMGKSKESTEQLERVVALREKSGKDELALADALGDLAEARETAGRGAEAEDLAKRAVAILRREAPEDDLRLTGPLSVVMHLAYAQSRAAESESIAREIWNIRRKHLGDDHPKTIESLLSVAASASLRGNLVEAERITREALERLTATKGERDHEVLIAMNNHMVCLQQLGRMAEAEEVGSRLLPLRTLVQGADHQEALASQVVYGRILTDLARYDKAEAPLNDARDKLVAKFGADHPRSALAESALAALYLQTGRADEAVAIRRRVLESRVRTLGASSPRAIMAAADVADALEKSGAVEEAASMCECAFTAHRAKFGAEHPLTLRVADVLGQIRIDQGRFEEAEVLFRETLAVKRADRGGGDLSLAATLRLYGIGLAGAGRNSEAVPILVEALTLADHIYGPEHPTSLRVRGALVKAYEALGDSARAEEARRGAGGVKAASGS